MHLVHSPGRLDEEVPGAEVVASREHLFVEPVEEIKPRVGDVHGGVEHLLDLARHHPKELVGPDEAEIHRGVANPLAALLRGAQDPIVLVAGDGAEAPEDLAEALRKHVRRGAHDVAAVEEHRPCALLFEDHQLPRVAALRDRRDDLRQVSGNAHVTGQPEEARTLAGGRCEQDLRRRPLEEPLSSARAQALARGAAHRVDRSSGVDAQVEASPARPSSVPFGHETSRIW